MKFTIITVCYNAQVSIRNTIESVLNQSYRDYEYLIIDGESNDGTLDIIREYEKDERIHVYVEKDFGIYNAMNRGICRAQGDFIYFLNAGDTFFEKDTLSKVVRYLENSNTIYYGSVYCVSRGGINVIKSYEDMEGSVTDKFLVGTMPCHQCIFAPKASLKNHFFQEKYTLRADYQWFYDSIFREYLSENIPVVVANYDMFGESGNVSNVELERIETKQVQKEFFRYNKVTIPAVEKPLQTEFEWQKTADKHLKMVKIMDSWLALKQQGMSLGWYFKEHKLESIAIYGLGYIGLRLLKELEGEVFVKFAIDRRKMQVNVSIKNMKDVFEKVDAIVITTISDYDEVSELLKQKIDCRIIRFDEIIQYCIENNL